MQLLKGLAAAAMILATSLPGSASAQTTADLSVSLVGSPTPAGHITWTITVTNLGPGQATGVTLEAFYGSDAFGVSATTTQGTCAHGGGFVDFSLGSIAAGGEVTATFVMQTFRGDGDFLDVNVTSNTEDPNPRNNHARETARVASPSRSLQGVGTFCPPVGGIATGGGGTAAGSQAWLATFGLLAMAGVAAAAVMRIRR